MLRILIILLAVAYAVFTFTMIGYELFGDLGNSNIGEGSGSRRGRGLIFFLFVLLAALPFAFSFALLGISAFAVIELGQAREPFVSMSTARLRKFLKFIAIAAPFGSTFRWAEVFYRRAGGFDINVWLEEFARDFRFLAPMIGSITSAALMGALAWWAAGKIHVKNDEPIFPGQ